MVQFAPIYNVQITNMNVDTRVIFDDSDKYGLPGEGAAFQKVVFRLSVESPNQQSDVQKLIEHAERGCHTAQSLRMPVNVTLETEITQPVQE